MLMLTAKLLGNSHLTAKHFSSGLHVAKKFGVNMRTASFFLDCARSHLLQAKIFAVVCVQQTFFALICTKQNFVAVCKLQQKISHQRCIQRENSRWLQPVAAQPAASSQIFSQVASTSRLKFTDVFKCDVRRVYKRVVSRRHAVTSVTSRKSSMVRQSF